MRRAIALLVASLALMVPARAHAIRPFITDDARVVGKGYVQLETWWRRDKYSLQHWAVGAIGPNDHLELSLGGVHGAGQLRSSTEHPTYALGGPLAQAKILLHQVEQNGWPGVGIVLGGIVPAGRGGFEAPGWSGFGYLAVSQAFFKEDDFLIHANVGLSAISAEGLDPLKPTWGVGTQFQLIGDLHAISELFSGDPYAQGVGGAYQVGFRIIFNDHLQLDATGGEGLWGDSLPVWFSGGIRIVSHKHQW